MKSMKLGYTLTLTSILKLRYKLDLQSNISAMSVEATRKYAASVSDVLMAMGMIR
jgi:hypothetical protein